MLDNIKRHLILLFFRSLNNDRFLMKIKWAILSWLSFNQDGLIMLISS